MNTKLSKPALWLAFLALGGSCWAQDQSSAPAADAGTGLPFNFHGAPLETVLNYMSEAAGFVVVLQTPVSGTVDMWSAQPVSRAEAVELLEIALNKNLANVRRLTRSLMSRVGRIPREFCKACPLRWCELALEPVHHALSTGSIEAGPLNEPTNCDISADSWSAGGMS